MIRQSARSSASAPTSHPTRTRSIAGSACRCSTWSRWCTGFIARCGRSISRKTDRERDRLDRRLPAQAADRFEWHVHRMRGQLGGGETAEAALTAAHAAARDRFEAVHFGRPEAGIDRGTQIACRDALAAADHDAVIEIMDRGNRPCEGACEAALKAA